MLLAFDSVALTLVYAMVIGLTLWQRRRLPGTEVRKSVLLLADLLVMSLLVSFRTMLCLTLVAVGCYVAGVHLSKSHPRSEEGGPTGLSLLVTCLAVLLAFFVAAKYPLARQFVSVTRFGDLNAGLSLVQTAGMSYLFFKLVHFLVDAYRGTLPPLDIITFLNYLFFFPTYLAGPIDRYHNFRRWLEDGSQRKTGLFFWAGLFRMFTGVVKKYGLVPLVIEYALDFDKVHASPVPLVNILLSLVAYSAYLYLDFSGYSDLAIGSGMMLGFRVPENFASPYLAGNIAEFWTRWHMTLCSILREYIFLPTVRFLSSRCRRAPRILVTILGYLVTFIICGMWHGSGLHYALWGLWHGVGLSVHKLWVGSDLGRRLGAIEPPGGAMLGRAGATVMTFAFVTLGWLFFNYPVGRIMGLWHSIR